MMGGRKFNFPQGLKPSDYGVHRGTAEAVPFQITFMGPLLGLKQIVWGGLFRNQCRSAPLPAKDCMHLFRLLCIQLDLASSIQDQIRARRKRENLRTSTSMGQ